jgi:hypothetical protein
VGGHQRLSILDALEGSAEYSLYVDIVDCSAGEEVELNVILNNPAIQGTYDVVRLEELFSAGKFRLPTNSVGNGWRSRLCWRRATIRPICPIWGPSRSPSWRRSARIEPIAAVLRNHWAGGRLTLSLSELASSYVHMHANRIFQSAGRAHELVLYDFLERLYVRRSARLKNP